MQPCLLVFEAVISILSSSTFTLVSDTDRYLWKFIRGSGLAYGAGTTASLESGTVGFYIYKAPDAAAAFLEGKRVIQGLADETVRVTFITYHLTSARCSTMTSSMQSIYHP